MNSSLTDTLWSKKNKTQSTNPNGNAIPTHIAGNSQNLTNHSLPPAGWNALPTGKVAGLDALNRPQYAIAEHAISAIGIP